MRGKTLDTERFSVTYSGEALQDGRMDIRHVATALLSVADLLSTSDQVLNGANSKVDTKIVATDRGSFEIVLEVVHDISNLFQNNRQEYC